MGDLSLPKPTAGYTLHFYGRMTPNSPEGEDLGLSEPAPTWDFPKSTSSTVIIRPAWTESKVMGFSYNHGWDPKHFDRFYPAALEEYGISQQDYNKIIVKLNAILVAFHPFTRNSEVYITEMRKHLTKLNQDYPKTCWELQIHKHVSELSPVLFFENVHHSIRISLLKVPMTDKGSGEGEVLKTMPKIHPE